MNKVFADFTKETGKIKPMHAVNNGPVKAGKSQIRENFNAWAECGIPYARNHDASINYGYGGEHTVDVWAIFPNPDADVNDPASYDFILTDEYTRTTLEAGTKIFYRLGNKIEHWVKKYGTLVPPDYKKWAQICEHIIMHYNEGWADGFNWNIEYWEIWNEPDLDNDESKNKLTWGGTKAQFFDFYEVAAKHLKSRFPHLKIGGPAISHRIDWASDFLVEMRKRNVPIDFFSWHMYYFDTSILKERQESVKKLLIENGYGDAETICDEWNYVKGWKDEFVYSVETIISLKGAAFAAACMLTGQHTTLDMMMYYDARPCAFNGLFDFYTCKPLKGYYVFKMFNELYKLGKAVEISTDDEEVYAVAATDGKDEAIMLCFYNDNDEDTSEKVIEFVSESNKEYEIFVVDEEKNGESAGFLKVGESLSLRHNTVVLLKSV